MWCLWLVHTEYPRTLHTNKKKMLRVFFPSRRRYHKTTPRAIVKKRCFRFIRMFYFIIRIIIIMKPSRSQRNNNSFKNAAKWVPRQPMFDVLISMIECMTRLGAFQCASESRDFWSVRMRREDVEWNEKYVRRKQSLAKILSYLSHIFLRETTRKCSQYQFVFSLAACICAPPMMHTSAKVSGKRTLPVTHSHTYHGTRHRHQRRPRRARERERGNVLTVAAMNTPFCFRNNVCVEVVVVVL